MKWEPRKLKLETNLHFNSNLMPLQTSLWTVFSVHGSY